MKTAWIFPGGAARAVYTAGVIYALGQMKVKNPDIIIGCSGSAPTSICYVTGQYQTIPKVWLKYLSTKKFVNFWRFWKIVDVDYLIDFAIKKENPLEMEKVINSNIKIFFPLTDSKTGKIEYFSNKSGNDLWEIIKAAVSVPFCTNIFSLKGNTVNGKLFSDSPAATRFQIHVKKAIKEGAGKIIVFDNWHPEDNNTNYFWSKLLTYARNSDYRKNQLNYIKEIENFLIPNNVEFIKIEPKTRLGMGRFEIDNDNAKKIFKRGYDDILDNPALSTLK